MICLSLNIRGFGGEIKVRNLRDLLRNEQVDFLVIQESLITGDAQFIVNLIWKHSSFTFCHSPAQGRSRGLFCIWNSDVFVADEVLPGVGYLGVAGFCKGCPMEVTILNIYGPQEAYSQKTVVE